MQGFFVASYQDIIIWLSLQLICVCVNYINTIMLLIMAYASMSCEWRFMFFRNTYFLPVFLLNSLDIMGPVLSYNLN